MPLPKRENVERFRKAYNKGRQRYNASEFVKSTLPANPNWEEHDIQVPVRDGTSIPTRVYLPNTENRHGAIVFFHGGGWFMGDLDSETHDCQVLCSRLGVAVFNVGYRLYPDVDFPVPIYDAYDSVKYVAAHHSEFGNTDLTRGFIVAGSSGGATWASIICHLARDDGLQPPLTGCHLTCPILTEEELPAHDEDTGVCPRMFGPERFASWDTHANGILMSVPMSRAIKDLVRFPVGRSQLLTPFHAQRHANLPPTHIQVCGIDPWRDCGIIYSEELEKAGVKTKLDIYSGLPHIWWTTFPMLKASRTRFDDMVKGVEWLLHGASKVQKL